MLFETFLEAHESDDGGMQLPPYKIHEFSRAAADPAVVVDIAK
jgi:hypothetical protein